MTNKSTNRQRSVYCGTLL